MKQDRFYNVNLTYIINNNIAFTGKQLKAILYLFKNITFSDTCKKHGGNTIKISKSVKNDIIAITGTTETFVRQLICVLKKYNLIEHTGNNIYKVNSNIVYRGYQDYFMCDYNIKYFKVYTDAFSITKLRELKEMKDLSLNEVKMLFYLLNTVGENNEFIFDKKTRKKISIKFNCSLKSVNRFYSKLKDYNIVIKINNIRSKINNNYIGFSKNEIPEKEITINKEGKMIITTHGIVIEETDLTKPLNRYLQISSVADERL